MLATAPPEVILGPDAPRDVWLKERTKGLGGSDCATALGLNPWMSPFALWLEKTGQLDDEQEETEPMLMGKLLEPVVEQRYRQEHPDADVRPSPGLVRHSDVHFLIGTPDRLEADDAVLEFKAPGYDFAGEWADDEVPARYMVQTIQYCGIMQRPRAVVAAIIGGQRYLDRTFEVRDETFEKLVERLDAWWTRHIVGGEPPEVDASLSTTEALIALYAANPGELAYLDEDAVEHALAYWAEHAQMKAHEAEKNRHGNYFRQALGNAEAGLDAAGRTVATWKGGTTSRFDQEQHKADHPDCHARYYRTDLPTRTLTIKKGL